MKYAELVGLYPSLDAVMDRLSRWPWGAGLDNEVMLEWAEAQVGKIRDKEYREAALGKVRAFAEAKEGR